MSNASSKYFIHLAYKGTNYQGWQRQINGLGVQAVLEDNLSRMFKQKILVHPCGRTDAGVHASQFFCHTILENSWDFDAVFRINKMLPADIRVFEFIPVADEANAQLDVTSRTYDYYIHLTDHPFIADLSTYYSIDYDRIADMQAAAKLLTKYTNFRSFCKQPDLYPNTICEVSFSELTLDLTNTRLRFSITANRFLRAMIRMIVGNLVKVGQREMDLATFEKKLQHPTLSIAPVFAYPQGLYLSKVVYPYLERPENCPLPYTI